MTRPARRGGAAISTGELPAADVPVMGTLPEVMGGSLATDRDDTRDAEQQAALLRARLRDMTVRLSLATFRARSYADVWGMEAEALVWEANAERIRADLADLKDQLAALGVVHRLAA